MRVRLLALALTLGLLGLAGCSGADETTVPPAGTSAPAPTSAAPSPTTSSSAPSTPAPTGAPSSAASSQPSTISEPTTTNTLPPPPRPSKPAATRAGELTARSLPVPEGWKTVARKGGSEEGYEGNGTWVHARDPRYAANGVITLGCADVTRDDYPDPTAALEGTYERNGQPGIGLVLEFASEAKAAAFWKVYLRQVQACRSAGGPVRTTITESPLGLIDRRTYPDGTWTEVGAQVEERVTLVLLAEDGKAISRRDSEALLRRLTRG